MGIETPKQALNRLRDFEDELVNRSGGKFPGIPTGIKKLDVAIGGLQTGGFHIVCGGMKSNKSTFVQMITRNIALAGKRCLVYDFENHFFGWMSRAACALGRISMNTLFDRTNELSRLPTDITKTPEFTRLVTNTFLIDDRKTVEEIIEEVELIEPDVLVVDSLHKISPSSGGRDRRHEIDHICSGLEEISKSIPVLTVSEIFRSADEFALDVFKESTAIGYSCRVALRMVTFTPKATRDKYGRVVEESDLPYEIRNDIQMNKNRRTLKLLANRGWSNDLVINYKIPSYFCWELEEEDR